jgi:hypothetical protein
MKFVLTNHAKYRILERGVSVSEIKIVIKNPDRQKSDKYGMLVARKRVNNKTLEVVFKIQGNSYIIITAYYEN